MISTAIFACFASACSHDHVRAPNEATATTTTTTANSGSNRNRDLAVSDDIVRACNLHFSNVEQAPKFDFDQAALLPDDQSVLDQVAQCVTTGPLHGHALKLVGRADPRGEVEYNFALGETRSDVVKRFLSTHGVDGAKVSTTSRGKLDATGTDEDSWRKDRRVDLLLN